MKTHTQEVIFYLIESLCDGNSTAIYIKNKATESILSQVESEFKIVSL